MRYILFFLIIFIVQTIQSQNEYFEIVKQKVSFVSDKSKATDTTIWLVINKDKFYSKYEINHDLSFLNDSLYSNKKIFGRYKNMVFQYSDKNSKKIYALKQWAAPIVVYLDNKLPKSVRQRFEEFYSQIIGVKNLSVSFTNKLEDSNYYIKVTTNIINGYKDDYKFYDEEEREKSILTGATYNLQTDKNHKFFSGILTVNPSRKDNQVLLKQLKQLFFLSLGQFSIDYNLHYESLLDELYVNNDSLNEYDLDILKIHYGIIYDSGINATTFNNLINLSNQN